MVTVDLITGFLGSGKTTFLIKYARHLMSKGEKICILENDYGAVNIDTMLLSRLYSEGCGIESVAGACDKDCHMRRFKTKLIAMGMSGFTRVIIEPSGIFDVDEFFDTLHDSPLDKWYRIGSLITIVDPTMNNKMSDESRYFLASQAAVAGQIVFSFCSSTHDNCDNVARSLAVIGDAMREIRCYRDPADYYTAVSWDNITPEQMDKIASCGFCAADFVKMQLKTNTYDSIYFMNNDISPSNLLRISKEILDSHSCGNVWRIKGFTQSDGIWYKINASHSAVQLEPVSEGQSVVIVIGEELNKSEIKNIFEKD